MTPEQARQILTRYRPGTADADDPEFAAALALCEQDATLRAWFSEQSRAQQAIRNSFRNIVPPAGLKEQIISEHRAALRAARWRQPALRLALTVALLLAVGLLWWQLMPPTTGTPALTAFRNRMVRLALSPYAMEIETNSLEQIRSYLAQQDYPADFELPKSLAEVAVVGCARTRWQGGNVSMICFRKGQPANRGEKSDLWLFVLNGVVADAPPAGEVKIAKVSRLTTASWSKQGKFYLLGTEGDEAALRSWLGL